jgi:hypothetical protein
VFYKLLDEVRDYFSKPAIHFLAASDVQAGKVKLPDALKVKKLGLFLEPCLAPCLVLNGVEDLSEHARLLLARQRFLAVFGFSADNWNVQCATFGRGAVVASALSIHLLESTKVECKSKGIQLSFLRPSALLGIDEKFFGSVDSLKVIVAKRSFQAVYWNAAQQQLHLSEPYTIASNVQKSEQSISLVSDFTKRSGRHTTVRPIWIGSLSD